jgi:hypothetical protein
MNRFAAAFAAVVSLAAPSLAQTNADGATPGAASDTATVAPAPSAAGTNLPGVTDITTTGSTSEPSREERCELPGASRDTNPTAQVPSVTEADPTCR